jgi:hypothetical protein
MDININKEVNISFIACKILSQIMAIRQTNALIVLDGTIGINAKNPAGWSAGFQKSKNYH